MGDFRDLPLLPEAPSTARITTWQVTRYGGIHQMSTFILRFPAVSWLSKSRPRLIPNHSRAPEVLSS